MTWHLPIATMSRVDDSTARLLAGTFGGRDRGERTDMPADAARMVLSPEQWRQRHERRAA